jgi:DNA-binding CsgD family transcriptional regulator
VTNHSWLSDPRSHGSANALDHPSEYWWRVQPRVGAAQARLGHLARMLVLQAWVATRLGDLRRLFDPADPSHHPFMCSRAIGDLAEAAIHSGHRDDALFQAALNADLSRWPFDRARLLLAYDAWLRRRRRVAESRAPLRAARETFGALGAAPWGELARQELRASGETSRRRTPEAWGQLSPQELQIAQMAADGLTNREIGQRLYLSHRTVGSHLYRIFPKLGITSRAQLSTVLDAASPA